MEELGYKAERELSAVSEVLEGQGAAAGLPLKRKAEASSQPCEDDDSIDLELNGNTGEIVHVSSSSNIML
jgi:hypothetical protein